MKDYTQDFVELIRRAATDLPADMENSLHEARDREAKGSAAESAFDTLIKNVEMAREKSTPVCQDTGTPIFEVTIPVGIAMRELTGQIRQACAIATEKAYLRPNAVDPLTGKNSGDNTGEDYPTIHFYEGDEQAIKVELLLKGGGCENVSAQYKLPDSKLGAGRDLDGVRRVVLDSVYQAQGKGCAPGVLGVAIGGDRGSSYVKAKQQLLRPLADKNENERLADLEDRIMDEANQLGIGPMGFGGETTVLGVKVGAQHRLPACYFVSIAYMCWANRRAQMEINLNTQEVSYA